MVLKLDDDRLLLAHHMPFQKVDWMYSPIVLQLNGENMGLELIVLGMLFFISDR